MKSNAKSSLYFSAYPLKAIKDPSAAATTDSPYLKAVLAGTGKIRLNGSRVFPMVNPYPLAHTTPVKIKAIDLHTSENEWFSNYE